MLSMAPNIVFAPNIRRTQNTDTGRKTQTQLIIGFHSLAQKLDRQTVWLLQLWTVKILKSSISIISFTQRDQTNSATLYL